MQKYSYQKSSIFKSFKGLYWKSEFMGISNQIKSSGLSHLTAFQ